MATAAEQLAQRLTALEAQLEDQRAQVAVAKVEAAQATQRATAAEVAASAAASASAAPHRATLPNPGRLVDARILGEPDAFPGDQAKWRDWSAVMRSYTAVIDPQLGAHMLEAEANDKPVLNSTLKEDDAMSSATLYFVLLMLCRGSALGMAVSSGDGQGLEACN